MIRLGAVLLALCLLAAPVRAQMLCKPRAGILAQLGATYKESPVAMGLASNGSVLEVLAAEDGNTWTILLTRPNGISCVMATGEGWQVIRRKETDPES